MGTTNKVTFDDGHTTEIVDSTEIVPIKSIAKVRVCKVCERELPITDFATTRSGSKRETCNKCCADARRESKENRIIEQRKIELSHDALFDGKQPVEVIQIMTRGKKWLESRGYEIVLRGSYVVKKDIKFE